MFEIHEKATLLPEPKFLVKVLYDFFTFSLNHFLAFTYTFNFCCFDENNNLIKHHDCTLEIRLVGLLTRDMNCIVFRNFLDLYSL
jgi:hypothetical protein